MVVGKVCNTNVQRVAFLCDYQFIAAGMLSKSKGQILRTSATLHVLFHMDTPLAIPETISGDAVKAAVDVCIQHAAFLAGRGDVQELIEVLAMGTKLLIKYPYLCGVYIIVWYVHSESSQAAPPVEMSKTDGHRSATTSLLLPGKVLHLNALNKKRSFRNSGNKAGAIHGFEMLQENGLGTIVTTKIARGAAMVHICVHVRVKLICYSCCDSRLF